MNRARKLAAGPGALDLIEETFHCLRRAPAQVWLIYYAGTLPFILGLLYFWADMSREVSAQDRLMGAALFMAGLFLWMKTCHCRFASRLMAELCGEPTPSWGLRGWLGVGLRQAAWQPLGLFALPIALIVLAPFAWVYAFFQNMTVLDQPGSPAGALFSRAWKQTLLWPKQNHAALTALHAFSLVVCLNLVLATLAVPQLVKALLGVESSFSRIMTNPGGIIVTILNTTFMSVVAGLTYLCVDPLLKTFYVLRCYYGESLRTGQDLRAELVYWRPKPALMILLAALFLTCSATLAAPNPKLTAPLNQLDPGQLDRAVDEVLSGREYRWRLPRVPSKEEKGFLARAMEDFAGAAKAAVKRIGAWLKKAIDFLLRNRAGKGLGNSPGWYSALRGVLVVLAFILVFLIVLLIVRTWRQRRAAVVLAQAVSPAPDLTDENIAADQLPEDGWLEMARQFMASGELRLALRAFYLASLAHLAGRQYITIAKFKSNWDYQRELEKRGHVLAELPRLFSENVSVFDRVWYGLHNVDGPLLERFSENVNQIRRAA